MRDTYNGHVGSGFDDARSAYVDRSALRYLETDVAHLERAAVQRLRAREVTVTQGVVGAVIADTVTVRQSRAGIIAGRSVAADEVHAAVLLAPVVRGDVHAFMDLRTAIGIGFGMALGKALITSLRLLFRGKP